LSRCVAVANPIALWRIACRVSSTRSRSSRHVLNATERPRRFSTCTMSHAAAWIRLSPGIETPISNVLCNFTRNVQSAERIPRSFMAAIRRALIHQLLEVMQLARLSIRRGRPLDRGSWNSFRSSKKSGPKSIPCGESTAVLSLPSRHNSSCSAVNSTLREHKIDTRCRKPFVPCYNQPDVLVWV